ncbi:Molybdopterin cofactor biosynthesis C domain-containing protein [Tuber indicum]|nr:Molybdopterin cofactor biosynthesis C domain-containing protein [Tuber indicum]
MNRKFLSSSGVSQAHIPGVIFPFITPSQSLTHTQSIRAYSTNSTKQPSPPSPPTKNDNPNSPSAPPPLPSPFLAHQPPSSSSSPQTLTHIAPTGEAHMVSISAKPPTPRASTACGRVVFSNPTARDLILKGLNKKGDVLGVARVAGIMAVKKTPEVIPLCHPILIDGVDVRVELGGRGGGGETEEGGGNGYVDIYVTVRCEGKTGVEMEALTGVSVAALTVFDMCKAVDKRMVIEGVRVVRKSGGRSGDFVE